MFSRKFVARLSLLVLAGCGLVTVGEFVPARARRQQQQQDASAIEIEVIELMKQQKYTQALPLLEKLVVARPDNAQAQFYLGFALIAQADNTPDAAARRALRSRARNAFLKSKELGIQEPVVDALIQSTAADGPNGPRFSENAQADKLMTEAEALFGRGKLDEALKNYQRALELDPKLYEAALFVGDVHTQRGDFAQAETWYQKAIVIDPTRETAYRYSATPLMRQGKHALARDRYIEAYISEPYNKFSAAGLTQWAQATNTSLAHPQIDVTAGVTIDDNGDAKINLAPDPKKDQTAASIAYVGTRMAWRKEKFRQTFPAEKIYRHSLAEEADALRSVLKIVAAANGNSSESKLTPALIALKKLDDENLLEAYILLARADRGIAQDHAAYLKQHRDRLRRYVVEYVVPAGGRKWIE